MTSEDDDAIEADMAIVYREVTGREWSPGPIPPLGPVPRDPDYSGDESLVAWWREHDKLPPTLILQCGINNCRELVGEVKSHGDVELALMYSRFGDRDVPYAPRRALSREALQGKVDELRKDTLKDLGDGMRVAKAYTAKASVVQLDWIGHIICPARGHGIVSLPDADATIADMRAFIAQSQHARKRRYLMFRGR